MKFWSDTYPRAFPCIRGLAGVALVTLTVSSTCFAQAENAHAPSTAAPAKPVVTGKPALPVKSRAKSAVASGPAECVRTGQRVIAALARDDSGAASQFHGFYIAFKCSPQHLAQAFGCLVNLQEANPGLSNPSPEQVTQCWEDPGMTPKVQPQAAPEASSEKK